MITRKRAARRDSECSSNSRQQDSPLPSVLESIPKVNNSNNLVTNPARIEAQLSRNLSSKKKRRYSYEQAKPKNTAAMNELETHNSTQSSSDCSRQPKPGTSTNTKAEPKPKSKPELIVDAESGSERELDSKSKVKTETEAKAKAKGKVKAVAEVELKAKPEVIQSKVGTENEPKLNVDSKSMAKAEVKPKLVPAKGGPENESNHSNAKENVPPKNQVLHRAVRPCVRLMKLFLPKKAVKSEEFITVLNNICIDKSDPSYYVHYELPGPERCAYCMKKYKPDKLQNHMLMKHWSIVVYSALLCPLCDSVFTDHLQLASHAIVDHAIMSNLCIICNHERISQESLIKHYQCEILGNTIHRCRFCQSYFSKLDSMKQHLQDEHFIMMEE